MDLRQSPQWAKFLSSIGWTVEKIGQNQIFIRRLPLLPWSVIKIQRPTNPLPFSQIDRLAKKYRALFVIIEPQAGSFNEQYFLKNNFRKTPDLSFLHTATIQINLDQTREELWSSLAENARRNIKKSQNYNLKLKTIFIKDIVSDEFDQFYKLLSSITKLKHFYISPKSEYRRKMEAFKNHQALIFAYHQNLPIACVWLTYFGRTMVYLQAGNTKKGYKFLANYLLVWEALKLAQKMKLKTFDFEGIFDPRFPKLRKSWTHFSDFKKRFHGQVILYPPPYLKYYNGIFKLFHRCSQVFIH